jgi:hypothetical protein
MPEKIIHIINFSPRRWRKFLIKVLATEDAKFLITEDDKYIQL